MEILTGPFVIDNLIGKPARDMWDELLDEGHRITAVAGSDDHRAGIDFDPGTQSPIGSPTTLVYADELSEAAILEGIAEGRVVVLLSGPDDPRVEIEIDSDSGELGRIGDTIRGQRLTIRARVTGGDGARAVLVTDGNDGETRAIEGNDAEVSWEAEAPESGARYRVHVVGGEGLVTVTNHVFVDFAAAPGGGGCGCQSGGSGGGPWLALLALALAFVRRR
jgi:MYXO-CTERM domain-containing protein